jgi:hypothetical protein
MRHRGDRPKITYGPPGDGSKIAYHPPCDRVKITYGDPLVTGDVRTLTLATVRTAWRHDVLGDVFGVVRDVVRDVFGVVKVVVDRRFQSLVV